MGTVLGFMGLILGAWAVRSICMKQQNNVLKACKALFAAVYFLGAGGLGGTNEKMFPTAIVMLLVGAAVMLYSNWAAKKGA
ncbi:MULTISPECIES: hypothetical protein [Erwinia]|jgi:hypothetical protein|uniref:hypothetical protein n=1 Tax=Erwinia TaxID=551 RepID=UPI00249E0DBD|nr:hypothetical protein [Erwinia sp. V90_4]MDI3438949.1 hypothetical protein [Erwinia sp. V90_4]